MITAAARALDFSPFAVFSEPFTYAVSLRAFNSEISFEILKWLEVEAPWKLVEADFYEQYEFSFVDANPPDQLKFLRDETFLNSLRVEVQKQLGVCLADRIDATAHRLVPGQRIRIHNDFIPGGESYRLLIQLNRGWRDEDGGFLLFFSSPDPADVHKIIRPSHNSAVAFAISPDSNHAVTTVHKRERFTLVYSFYLQRDDFKSDGAA
jgi:Rps23 Pro-64 3,4-dihydroxylase Tpa1-like proline 4-hydroxylase